MGRRSSRARGAGPLSEERPDIAAELGRLKGFQRRAAENAFHRLFRAEDRTGRFLIADEVGLGKTLIARGIAALAIDHLWNTVERIDVVYVCSNASIARQNVARLGFGAMKSVERLTLLPVTVDELEGAKLNFVAITPGTSLETRSNLGIARERRLLYHMMQRLWPVYGSGPMNLLQGGILKPESWRESLELFLERNRISEPLQEAFHDALRRVDGEERESGGPGIRARWEGACVSFRYFRKSWSDEQWYVRRELISELRRHLARVCIGALEPDLVILDEFQRFKHLLQTDSEDEAALLAQRLFEWSDGHDEAHVLLLSATPYKMYTLSHESEEDDHYADFLRTVAFLQRDEARTRDFKGLLEGYRRGLFRLAEGDERAAIDACRRIEVQLRRVMSRTERTGATGERDGMLRTVTRGTSPVMPRELVDFVALDRLARELGVSSVIETWKSAPYLLSFSEEYELDRRMMRRCARGGEERVEQLVAAAQRAFLDPNDVEAYGELDPANSRLRALLEETVDSGLWRCLWLPPSAPSYEPAGAYARAKGATKRLVFSAWTVVPRAISAMVSYEVERQAFLAEDPEAQNTAEDRERRRPLLRFQRAEGRLTGMPVLGLLCPSAVLARLGDPRRVATVARADGQLTLDDLLQRVQNRVAVELAPFVANAPSDGPVDEAWYWAAPILMDLAGDPAAQAFWDARDLAYWWAHVEGEDAGDQQEVDEGWSAHVGEARQLVAGVVQLGRVPDDLSDVLARVAVAGPATAALRSLARVLPDAEGRSVAVRFAAAQIAWGFRALFNRPEATAIVRGPERRIPLWRLVLDHCVYGCLGDVLDEHLHLLRDLEGLFNARADEAARVLAMAMRAGTGIRTTRTSYRALSCQNGSVEFERYNLRGHYALAFSSTKSEREDRGMRMDQVRAAFNSPFWPFVLASTSVGQEGLDFHAWCHAVVHWNLPPNPIDLEQREGRVHRFKGHAVRKNVAASQGAAELAGPSAEDPWAAMFERARLATQDDKGGLVPYWVYEVEDGAHIERHVPALPHSRDLLRFEALRRSLALYRMVFGQPRQDDLMAFLMDRVPDDVRERVMGELRVDLAPF